MSLLPIIFGDSITDSMRPSRLLDQHFGVPIEVGDLNSPLTIPNDFRIHLRRPGFYKPWRSAAATADSGSTVMLDKDKFQVNLDVQQFKPEEISVKITGKNEIIVEGKHEEKQDEHGFISRHFVRKYIVPKGHDIEKVVSQLSSDGVLSILAPKNIISSTEHREIPITQTGQPALDKKEEKKE